MDVLTIVIITLVTSAVAGYAASKIASKVVKKRGEKIIKEAEAEGEMIKKERILQAKEKFIQLKSEHDRAVNEHAIAALAEQDCAEVYDCPSAAQALALALGKAGPKDCVLVCGSLYLIGETEKILKSRQKMAE